MMFMLVAARQTWIRRLIYVLGPCPSLDWVQARGGCGLDKRGKPEEFIHYYVDIDSREFWLLPVDADLYGGED